MRKPFHIVIFLSALLLFLPALTQAVTELPAPTFQAHLWLGDQDTDFSDYENSPGYVGINDDPWLNESIVDADPFDLYIYNASSQISAVDVHVIATIHAGETGSFSFFGSTFDETDFSGSGLPPGHNGSHGVWSPSGDGLWLDISTLVDIGTRSSQNFGTVSFSGFSEVHFDAYSEPQLRLNPAGRPVNFVGLRNPYSHDKTSREVPEPSTLLFIGVGILGIATVRRKKIIQ